MQLKNLVRTGWMLRGIPPSLGETVASHTFEVSLLALLLSRHLISGGVKVDLTKVLTLALIHDLPEAVEGDVVKWYKDRVEEEVNLTAKLDVEAVRYLGLGELSELLEELNELSSLEAEIVKYCDHLATYLQARRYLKQGYERVKDIIKNTENIIKKIEKFPKLKQQEETLKEFLKTISNEE